jgi:UDP-galactopyranose mutase
MQNADLIVVGGGISGLALAWKASQAGKQTLVLERDSRIGGCIHTHRGPNGYWFEMGAHTAYNSYGAFLDIALGSGLRDSIIPRGPARAHFGLLQGDRVVWLTPPKVLIQLDWIEAALHLPLGLFHQRSGQTLGSYYSRLVGPRNYRRVLSPFLSAVPSQNADGFPLQGPGSLFKKRSRRGELARSLGFEGGLQLVCLAAARAPGVTVETGVAAVRVSPGPAGFVVATSDGLKLEAPAVGVAAPPEAAAALLLEDYRELAEAIQRVKTVEVESLGVVLPRERCWMPECAFVVPVAPSTGSGQTPFFSAVTRDPFPDPRLRAFAFHFRAGLAREAKLRRVSEVLRVPLDEVSEVVERRVALPAPALGHAEILAEIDRRLSGKKLALTGNYFSGMAIEDCVLRSNSEWARIAATEPALSRPRS